MALYRGPSRPPDRRTYRPTFNRGPSRPPDLPPYKPPKPPSSVVAAAGAPRPTPPNYGAQAQSQVSAILDPQLKYIADHYNTQALGVSGAMQGITDSYAGKLGQLAGNIPGIFGPAKKTISAAAQGINAQLTKLGASTAATEASAMAAARQPGAQSPDITLAADGKGAGGAAGAIGDAMIASLAAEQKAAIAYAEKLPGFAQLEGHQQIASALATLSAQMAEQMAQTTAQAPQLFYTIYQNLLDRAQRDKQFAFQVRQYNDRLKQQKASIVGPNAPTLAGRNAYWQSMAAQRTKESGDQWMGTNTGIRPVDADPTKPGIQRQRTVAGQSADYLNQGREASAKATTVRAAASAKQAQTAATKAAAAAKQAQIKEDHRHAEAQARIAAANRNAKTAEQRAAIAKRAQAETARHNKETERIAKAKAASSGSGKTTPRKWKKKGKK